MITIKNYENVVYISHPYGGLPQNEVKVAKIIKHLMKKYPTYLFLSPIHAFSFAYECTDYQDGLDMCLYLLHQVDECWVYGDWEDSRGCLAEIEYCKEHLIPYSIESKTV